MKRKELIPTPLAQKWREFRFSTVPVLMVGALLFAVAFLWQGFIIQPTFLPPAPSRRAEVVSPNSGYITNLHVARFQEVKKDDIIAEIIINESSLVKPQPLIVRAPVSGTISMVYRSEGQTVRAGEPIVAIKQVPVPELAGFSTPGF